MTWPQDQNSSGAAFGLVGTSSQIKSDKEFSGTVAVNIQHSHHHITIYLVMTVQGIGAAIAGHGGENFDIVPNNTTPESVQIESDTLVQSFSQFS